MVWNGRTKVTKFDDLLTNELNVGGTGAAADTDQFPRIINGVLGTQDEDHHRLSRRQRRQSRDGARRGRRALRLVVVERGLDPRVLDQGEEDHHPDAAVAGEASRLPDVPLITELAKTDEQRAILRLIFARQALGRPFLAPPGVPADRVAALREAFMATMKDKDFLAEADKAQLEITPISGDAVQKLVDEIYRDTARGREEGGGNPEVAATARELSAAARRRSLGTPVCRA